MEQLPHRFAEPLDRGNIVPPFKGVSEGRGYHSQKISGFTLVELIVVITILVILGTIAFINLGNFAGSARDGARISNLANLKKWLDLYQIKAGTYPMPESAVTITASGVTIGYQGFAKDQVGSVAKISKGGTVDPSDANMYPTYSVNANQTKMQLMGFLEDGSSVTAFVPTAFASASSDYSKRTPTLKGDALGILLGNGTGNLNQPVQETTMTGMDLTKTMMGSGYALVFSKSDTTASVVTSGTGAYTGSLFTFTYNKREDLLKDKTLAGNDPSLVGYWDMETTVMSGSQVLLKDLSGYGNNGVCYNGTSSGSCGSVWPQFVDGNGKSGKAMSFDGVDENIRISHSSSLEFWTGNATFFVVYTPKSLTGINDPSGIRLLTNNDYPIGASWGIDVYKSNYDLYLIELNGDGSDASHANGAVFSNKNTPINQSNSIGIIMNRSINKATFYTNGAYDTNKTINSAFDSSLNPTNKLFIWGDWNFWNGTIDEVRIYNRALSDSEIQTLYNATK